MATDYNSQFQMQHASKMLARTTSGVNSTDYVDTLADGDPVNTASNNFLLQQLLTINDSIQTLQNSVEYIRSRLDTLDPPSMHGVKPPFEPEPEPEPESEFEKLI